MLAALNDGTVVIGPNREVVNRITKLEAISGGREYAVSGD